MEFFCKEDGVVPEEFLALLEAGGTCQVLTGIGWISLHESEVEFRNNLKYRVIVNGN